jgi:hypothetical protein
MTRDGTAQIVSADVVNALLSALEEQLRQNGCSYDLVVVGGSAQADELIGAARWAREHHPSEGFLSALREALSYFGVQDADLGD